MKFGGELAGSGGLGRTPHGVRGLKYVAVVGELGRVESHPSRGAWIEMANLATIAPSVLRVAPLTGCVD